MNEEIRRLEEKIAHLEHHVTEQDKVMLELGDQLARLRREMERLAGRIAAANNLSEPGVDLDRPPHY